MKIDWLKPLLGHPGPFATLYLDATPSDKAADRDVANRWRAARKDLVAQGAPQDVLDAVEEVVDRPTWVAGPHGRVVVADGTGVLVDRVLHEPPTSTKARWSPVPELVQTIRAADESVELLMVTIDRQGADFMRAGFAGRSYEVYTAPHDEIAKVASPGTSQTRIESRAEDSWGRNADAIAAEVERRVDATHPELVILTGDVRAVSLVHERLHRPVAECCVEVPGGARRGAASNGGGSFTDRVSEALDSFRERRRERVLAQLRQGLGRDEGAVSSVGDVVAVLARGQVAELVFAEEYGNGGGQMNGRTLWVGPEPVHIAPAREDLEALGVGPDGIRELPAVVALVRAAIGQDAGLTFAPEGSVGAGHSGIPDGVAATLRWHDGETPHEVAATMSGDDVRLRGDRV
ncbi:Vms1/Ankzf1 family peptidyl-tRNA hydrolase [Myceligenerans crystallogenes]|uniref:Vms1/Ankzf1 family peptidyl-tRNA hydrolase n=1 Tax=Myceligenerans crystallogenes TaxID=316335 RepID=A0ABN2NRZ8_9MICO